MRDVALSEIVGEMRKSQHAIGDACAHQGGGWRLEVVRRRRELSEQIGRLGAIVNEVASPTPSQMAFRSRLSDLRAVLAEHQTVWPAVSIEPSAERYLKSVARVPAAYDALDGALAAVTGENAINFLRKR